MKGFMNCNTGTSSLVVPASSCGLKSIKHNVMYTHVYFLTAKQMQIHKPKPVPASIKIHSVASSQVSVEL